MVRQVLVTEKVNLNGSDRILAGQLAFGTHKAKFFQNDDGEVQTAIALGAQEIRIILDEIVRGNSLEELACADGTFSRIPNGTTPDDIADCAGPADSLIHCTKVCLNADGSPVGILDANEDGAVDDMRMIDYNDDPDVVELGVTLVCDGVAVPLDPDFSFWSPSGNQTFPSNPTLGFRGLGPAIVARPLANVGLRTGAVCSISFRPEVTDYDGNPVCAPEGGDIDNDCDNGDTSRLTFSSEPLKLTSSAPSDMSTNVPLNASAFILVGFNANIDADTVDAITLTANGADVAMTAMPQADDKTSIVFNLGEDFEPNTEYVMTIGTELKDLLGGSLAAEKVVTWTTEAFGFKSSSPSNGQTNAPMDVISLDFNGAVDPATLGSITMTKDGTPDPGGEPAADGVNVAITPTIDPMDASIVLIDLGDAYEANTYYEVVIGTGLTDAGGTALPAAELITWTTEGLALVSSAPANNATDVPLNPPSILLTFNTAVTQASATAAISLTAGGTPVVVAPVVQADAREVAIDLGADFTAATEYILTISTALQDAKGAALAAEATVTWTTVN